MEVLRLQVAHTTPQFAEDEHFVDMCKFIVDVGSLEAPFVKDLIGDQRPRRRGKFGLIEII